MDYENKYRDLVEAVKKLQEANPSDEGIQEWVKDNVPELKESEDEDEKIRKSIIAILNNYVDDSNTFKPKMIAWLEKQGENTTTLPKWKYKKDNAPLLRDSIILNKYGCVAKSPSGALVSDVWVMDYAELAKLPKEEFEKQDEQKPAIIIPKFRVGDEIKTVNEEPLTITKIDKKGYWSEDLFICDFNDDVCWDLVEQKPAAWSVGDLPEFESYLCLMFQKFRTKGVCTNGEIVDFVKEHSQKLKDTLCHVWSEEDEKIALSIEQVMNCASLLNIVPEKVDKIRTWLKSLRPQNRCAYNPYKEVVESIAEMCKHYDKANHSGLRDFYDNVKVKCKDAKEYDSLYPQNTWKPSEEQMRDLIHIISQNKGNAIGASLETLAKELKNL